MNRLIGGVAVGLLAVGGYAVARVVGSTPVVVRFKYKTGQVQRLKVTSNFHAMVDPLGPAHLTPVQAKVSSMSVVREKVTGTRKGVGTVSTTTESGTGSSFIGQRVRTAQTVNGKTEVMENGKRLPSKKLPVTITKRDARGDETRVSPKNPNEDSTGDLLFLPDRPVKVGDTWERRDAFRPHLFLPIPSSIVPKLDARFTYKLKGIEKKDGRRIAVIDVSGGPRMDTPKGTLKQYSADYSGTSRFDIDRGMLLSGKYRVKQAFSISFAEPGADPNGLQGLQSDGVTEIIVQELPAAAKE
jgi:hypothetical protein